MRDIELDQLDVMLRSSPDMTHWDRREYRRQAVRLDATIKSDGVSVPCTVTDVGAGGSRVHNHGGLPVEIGDRVTLTLKPLTANLRIDVPASVRSFDPNREFIGLQFRGAPIICHQRRDLARPANGRRRTDETPIARGQLPHLDLVA